MRRIEQYWYRLTFLNLLLLPFALLFAIGVSLRRFLYLIHALPSSRLPVPVVIIGNITMGGTGKTPLVIWLANFLQEQGWRPGIISRGYGGAAKIPQTVKPESDPVSVGDEPVLLARRCRCPVWIGRNRAAAGKALLAAHPECNVLVSDDGLQHYRLRRDVEIAVVDGERKFGNGLPLPAGPLRELAGRLNSVDAVVVHDGEQEAGAEAIQSSFTMRFAGETFYNLLNPDFKATAADLRGKKTYAVAGVGNPQRFFRQLQKLGLTVAARPFPDHHLYRPEDLYAPDAEAIIMTEKDAVKCGTFADEKYWVLAVDVQVPRELGLRILKKLRMRHGPQTA
ncbi:MAG TPA: tetraacyldisaccharide 4'-kinase [Burkholderiales bacterium]|nr:tetraacyldisaccharide 4'-kinase [Burkholderiales bacterium]